MRILFPALLLLSASSPSHAADPRCPAFDCRPQDDRVLFDAVRDWVIQTNPSRETIQVCMERLRNLPRCEE